MTIRIHFPNSFSASSIKISFLASLLIVVALPALGQAGSPATLAFEVASIKPVKDPNPDRTRDRKRAAGFLRIA